MFPGRTRRPGPRAGLLFAALLGLAVGLLPGPAAADAPSPAPPAAAAATGTFRNPLNTGPDPFMTHWKGNYYLTTTQGDSIRMWRSRRWARC